MLAQRCGLLPKYKAGACSPKHNHSLQVKQNPTPVLVFWLVLPETFPDKSTLLFVSNVSWKKYVAGMKGVPLLCQSFGPACSRCMRCLVPALKQM